MGVKATSTVTLVPGPMVRGRLGAVPSSKPGGELETSNATRLTSAVPVLVSSTESYTVVPMGTNTSPKERSQESGTTCAWRAGTPDASRTNDTTTTCNRRPDLFIFDPFRKLCSVR